MTIMKWDTSRLHEMVSWVPNITDGRSPEVRGAAFAKMSAYVSEVIEDRMAHPGNDPISLLLNSEVDGVRLDPDRVKEMTHLLFLAGLDTVTNAMTFAMHYLATDPALQDRLRAHPEDIPKAVEELLRRFSFVVTYRRVAKDTVFKGVFMKEGDLINCSLAGGSNDARIVDNPAVVDIDRKGAPNLAFNTGPHACVGAPLARAELRILLEEWLARMPNVSLAPAYVAPRHTGSIAKIERLDLVWD
jgi:cytochrome P450